MQDYGQLLFQRMIQGDSGWVQAVYLAGMFGILIWRRETVVNWWLFRTSYLLYGGALVAPPILGPLIQLVAPNQGGGSQVFTYIAVNAIGPTLLAGAVMCALGSMIPRLMIAQPAAVPQKHPLD